MDFEFNDIGLVMRDVDELEACGELFGIVRVKDEACFFDVVPTSGRPAL